MSKSEPASLLTIAVPLLDAVDLLLPQLKRPAARVMLVAVGWQESRWRWRRQRGGGPARGLLQFERVGVRGVLTHPATRALGLTLLSTLRYPTSPIDAATDAVYLAVEHNDVLCLALGRLLLWTHPDPLPEDAEAGWAQYVALWRPGRPRRETWDEAWRVGLEVTSA